MSDTPRTEQEKWNEGFAELVTANFARQLERELAEAKKDITRYQHLLITNKHPQGIVLSDELRNKIDKAIEGG
jgi:hypothetical protein